SNGDKGISKMCVVVAGEFLTMFSFDAISVDIKTALSLPFFTFLTSSTAIALFGSDDDIGKTFTLDTTHELNVTAVINDVPSNSSLQFDLLLPSGFYEATQSWYKEAMTDWQHHSFKTFVELQEGADVSEVNKQIASLEKDHNPFSPTAENFLHPLEKLHLYTIFENGKAIYDRIEYVRVFAIIAVFILVIACINFTNLATARSHGRAREVGIRKTIGSQRKQLIIQFIGESLVITTIACFFALVIIEITLPFYNMVVGKALHLQYSSPSLYAVAAMFIVVTALMAGAYPAFYLSSFQPAKVLKGIVSHSPSATVSRKSLVSVQFGVSIFLVIGSVVMYQQIMHVKSRHVGYDKENLLLIWSNDQREQNYSVIKQQLLTSGLVAGVTKSSAPITRIF